MEQEEDQSSFKQEVKQWIKSQGFDYKWIADQCGVSEITVRNWMSQKNIPTLKRQLIQRLMNQLPDHGHMSISETPVGVQVNTALSLHITLSPEIYGQLQNKAESLGIPLVDLVASAISNLAKNSPIQSLKSQKIILPRQ